MAFDPGWKSNATINVTPLIDILLVLLITFLLIAPVTPKGEDTKIPRNSGPQPTQPEPIVLQLTNTSGQVHAVQLAINQQRVEWSALDDTLGQLFKKRGDKTLFLAGDREIDFCYIAQAVDVARTAGVDNVALMRMPGR